MTERAIITGAASGIGNVTAKVLLAENPDLILIGADLTEGWSGDLAQRHGRDRVREVVIDVTDHAAVQDTIDRLADELGPPTQLVNCAGIQYNCPALDLTYEGWRRVLSVNLDGTFSCCLAAGRHMVAATRGSIVNLASVSMYFGLPRRVPYVTSKNAVAGLTQGLAVEWGGHGVRVNAVAPGYVETPLLTEAFAKGQVDRAVVSAHAALKRVATPAEIAGAIAFLLSDQAGFITGTVVDVDGGYRRTKP